MISFRIWKSVLGKYGSVAVLASYYFLKSLLLVIVRDRTNLT